MSDDAPRRPEAPLRKGWTTGACAAAAAKAAFEGLHAKRFPNAVTIRLPRGERPTFAIAETASGDGWASAGVIKDAGDDPDVTHGALIRVTLSQSPGGIEFRAGEGVGMVTRAGLPIPPGEPAINPGPRAMIAEALRDAAEALGAPCAAIVTIAIPGGEKLAERTLNGRLGIVGGLSILGTSGIVTPYSCAAWVHTIHRGIDVALAAGQTHVLGATGSTSEAAAQRWRSTLRRRKSRLAQRWIGGRSARARIGANGLRSSPAPQRGISRSLSNAGRFRACFRSAVAAAPRSQPLRCAPCQSVFQKSWFQRSPAETSLRTSAPRIL